MFTKIKIRTRGLIKPTTILATAQIAFIAMCLLSFFNIPHTDFLQGLFCGYAIVGNLFYLINYRRSRKEE
jgi:hypothetical protein